MSALSLAAVGGSGVETSVANAADDLLAVVLAGKGLEGGIKSTSAKTKDEVKGGLLLDVVVGKGATILELLSGEDETLLIRGDSLLVLDLLLDLLDGVGTLNLKGDGLSRESLDENLHSICGHATMGIGRRKGTISGASGRFDG